MAVQTSILNDHRSRADRFWRTKEDTMPPKHLELPFESTVRERLPLAGLSPEAQRVGDESLSDRRRQEWAAAEALTMQVADDLRAHDLAVEDHAERAAHSHCGPTWLEQLL
jgi:hypothetical protein